MNPSHPTLPDANRRKLLRAAGGALCLLAGVPRLAAAADAPEPIDPHAQHMGHEHMGHDHMGHEHHHAPAPEAQATRSVHSYAVPDVPLLNAAGKATTLARELDTHQPVLLNFIFTSCTAICPVLSATFVQVQDELGADQGRMRMLSISIDPEYDTPARLKAYAEKFGAGPQWHFLTGQSRDILTLQRGFDVYRGSKMNHPPATFLRPARDAAWVRYDGFVRASDLVADYRRLVAG